MTYGSDMSFPYYPALDGSALEGVAYFGVAGQNPVTNPVTVFWDSAGTQPASQPVTISKGRTVRSDGTPARVWVASDYSVLVQDTLGRQVVFEPNQPVTIAALNAINQAAAQAGIATTQAGAASASATSAAGSANAAQTASNTALAADRIYATATAGDTGTSAGQYYYVVSASSTNVLELWLHNGSGGSDTGKRFPSSTSLNDVAGTAISVFQNVTDATRNLFDASTVNASLEIVRSTGALTAAGSVFTTGYIPVVPGGQFIASAAMAGDATFGGYAFYDRNLTFVSGGAAVAANTAVTVPSSVVWMRCSFATTVVQTTLMICSGSSIPANYKTHTFLDKLATREATHAQIMEDHGVLNLFDLQSITDNNFLTSNSNALTSNSNYYVTNYIPVVQGGTVTFNGTTSLGSPFGLTWYDINKTWITGAAGSGTPPVAGTAYTVPFGAAYVRCTFDHAGNPASGLVAVQGPTLPTYYVPYGVSTAVVKHLRHWADAGVMFLGDSITANYPGAQQWPKWLCGRLDAQFIANNGAAGRVMTDLVKDPSGVALLAAAFASVDLVICFAGTNDFNAAYGGAGTLGSPSDAAAYGGSFCAATKYVIETLYGLKSTMRVVFLTPQYRSAVPAAGTPTPAGKTLFDYVDAVKNCCGLYGVPALDLLRTSGLNSFNSGTYLADGLHPTSTDGGVTIIGKPAAAFLSSVR